MDSSPPSNDLSWTIAQTVASYLGLAAIFLAIFTLSNERVQRVRSRDIGSIAAEPSKMGHFYVPRVTRWSAFWGNYTKVPEVTTIGGLIEAGDSYLWTSAVLDYLPQYHGDVSWVPLYSAIFNEVGRDEAAYNSQKERSPVVDIFLYRARAKLGHESDYGRIRSRFYSPGDKQLVNCCKSLKFVESQSSNYPSRRRRMGLTNIESTWLHGRKPCVATSREELAALGLVLGLSLRMNERALILSGVGAFGTSLYATQDDGTWKVHLSQGSRITRHLPSPGSGYTTLMAKHLACGSLPFADSTDWIKSIYLTDDVLQWIREGKCIQDVQSFGGPSLEYLRRLPGAKQIDAFYGEGTQETDASRVGTILNSKQSPVMSPEAASQRFTWAHAVVGIAFGGLVPQASENLAEAVKFTIAGTPGKYIDELEGLVNALHHHHFEVSGVANRMRSLEAILSVDPHGKEELMMELDSIRAGKGIFGEHVTTRCLAMEGVDFVNYTTPPEARNASPRDAAAVFARYMTLLERLAALVDVGNGASDDRRVEMIYVASCNLIQKVYAAAADKNHHFLTDPQRQKLDQELKALGAELDGDLGNTLFPLRQKINAATAAKIARIAITPDECASVVRCILAAWASQVPHIELREQAILGSENGNWDRAVGSRAATLDDLPPVSALH
jgi:hypothetical protein